MSAEYLDVKIIELIDEHMRLLGVPLQEIALLWEWLATQFPPDASGSLSTHDALHIFNHLEELLAKFKEATHVHP